MASSNAAREAETVPRARRAGRAGGGEPRQSKKVKVTISLTESQYEDLVRLADEHEMSLSQLVTRGIALQKFLLENKDSELLLKRGSTTREVVLVG
jgi:hypothetical protein